LIYRFGQRRKSWPLPSPPRIRIVCFPRPRSAATVRRRGALSNRHTSQRHSARHELQAVARPWKLRSPSASARWETPRCVPARRRQAALATLCQPRSAVHRRARSGGPALDEHAASTPNHRRSRACQSERNPRSARLRHGRERRSSRFKTWIPSREDCALWRARIRKAEYRSSILCEVGIAAASGSSDQVVSILVARQLNTQAAGGADRLATRREPLARCCRRPRSPAALRRRWPASAVRSTCRCSGDRSTRLPLPRMPGKSLRRRRRPGCPAAMLSAPRVRRAQGRD